MRDGGTVIESGFYLVLEAGDARRRFQQRRIIVFEENLGLTRIAPDA